MTLVPNSVAPRRIVLGGVDVDLLDLPGAVDAIVGRACVPADPPLAVVSANVDHINHFGAGGRWQHVLDGELLVLTAAGGRPRDPEHPRIEWLSLIDGAPLASKAHQLTGQPWPRLAGSDLIGPVLAEASELGIRVGVLGGSREAHELLRAAVAVQHPQLVIAGLWSPSAEELADPAVNRRLAAEIRASRVELLVVGLGKPRQELWMAEYGVASGARVMLAFGAAVDFLGGRIRRAPRIVSRAHMEWLWRLVREPRRLARRYLVEGPVAYVRLRTRSSLDGGSAAVLAASPGTPAEVVPPGPGIAAPPAFVPSATDFAAAASGVPAPTTFAPTFMTSPGASGPGATGSAATGSAATGPAAPRHATPGDSPTSVRVVLPAEQPFGFVAPGEPAEVTAVIVAYDSADSLGPLIADLREEARGTRLRVVVADNDSADRTLEVLAGHPDVVTVRAGGNLGFAGGINRAAAEVGECEAILVLNADLRLVPGAVAGLLERLRRTGAGVVVPLLCTSEGEVQHSLRREPTQLASWCDALLGDRAAGRPSWLTETDHTPESYRHAHPVEWATGAALLVSTRAARRVGPWDERYFLYSEETDFLRRMRAAGETVWFEPSARVVHDGGGSGGPEELTALMAVNRVRYAGSTHGALATLSFRGAALLGELLRSAERRHRHAAGVLLRRSSWERLPHRTLSAAATVVELPRRVAGPAQPASGARGAVIVPAHDEEAGLARTLAPLAASAREGALQVVVVCNGCSDRSAEIAASFEGVTVLALDTPSKAAALNAGDAFVTAWPRMYLDADIELELDAVTGVLDAITADRLLAARPAFRYETGEASAPVRAFYRARMRLPSVGTALWGAGGYAVSEQGHARFAGFPAGTADDVFVDTLFDASERRVVETPPLVVRVPRRTAGLIRVLGRTHSGNRPEGERTTGGTLGELRRSARTLPQAGDAAAYAVIALASRLRPRAGATEWARDDSSRTPTRVGTGSGREPARGGSRSVSAQPPRANG